MASPVDSLTEDIDLLIASIGLLSSIADSTKKSSRENVNDPSTPSPFKLSLPPSPLPVHDKEPPCDVPRGIEEESCPPSPVHLRLDLPKRYSDQETEIISASSDDSARGGGGGGHSAGLLTPQQSLGDELLSSISSPILEGAISEDCFLPPSRLHIEEHIMSARSAQALPLSSVDPIEYEKPLPMPSVTMSSSDEEHEEEVVASHYRSLSDHKPRTIPVSDYISSGQSSDSSRHVTDDTNTATSTEGTAPAESPSIERTLREFSKLYESNTILFGTHSRSRSAPVNELPVPIFSSTLRVRPGRPEPLKTEQHVRSMVDLHLPPIPRSPPPVPPTLPEGYPNAPTLSRLSRQTSMKTLPSQLRYQLSKGSLRRPLPNLPPLNNLDNRPRPQTEFRLDEVPSGIAKDPRLGAIPYTSPPGQTHFSVHTRSTPLMEQDEPTHPSSDEQTEREQSQSQSHLHHDETPLAQLNQFHRGSSSPSVFSEMSMSRSDPEPEGNRRRMSGEYGPDGFFDDDDDAQSYMSNPLDGMRSPISPDNTIFLDGRPRPRRSGDDGMGQPKSFFDLGFDMEIGKLEKRSRWKFWSKLTKHHKRSK